MPRWLSGLLIGLSAVAVLLIAFSILMTLESKDLLSQNTKALSAFEKTLQRYDRRLEVIENRLPEEDQIKEILALAQRPQDTPEVEKPGGKEELVAIAEETAQPEEEQEVPTATPEPGEPPEEKQWTLSGYVYKGETEEGVAKVGVYVVAVGQDESESYDKLSSSETDGSGRFTLEFGAAATQEQPLRLELMIESHELWNHVRAVQPPGAGWTVPKDHEDRFEGKLTDPEQASGEIAFQVSIRREFTGYVKDPEDDGGVQGAQVLLLRGDGDTAPTTEDWKTATAVYTATTDANGLFKLVDVSLAQSAYYQIRQSRPGAAHEYDLTKRPKFVEQWRMVDEEADEVPANHMVETEVPVTGTEFEQVVTFYDLEVEGETTLVPKEGATVHRYPGTPPSPADSRPVPSGTDSLEVLSKWSEGDWWLACCIYGQPLWIGRDDVEAPPTASFPTVYLPQISEGQGWQKDSPDWILTYYVPKFSIKESTVVTWTLGSLEAGQYQLEAWVPSDNATARVQYEVVVGAGQALKPAKPVNALDQSSFSTEFKEIGIYALVEASEVVVRLYPRSATLGGAAFGVLEVGAGPLRVVRLEQ